MHIFLTGSSGRLGSYVQDSLHAKGHTVTATDISPRVDAPPSPSGSIFIAADLRDYRAVEQAMRRIPCDAVMHLAAIPSPVGGQDQREVHNTNVTTSYNVLRTAADLGIKRIVQASSVNATGLAYSRPENVYFEELPLHEGVAMRPEDPYSLSKLICEAQADALCRLFPDLRIASLRFHALRHTRKEAAHISHRDLCGYSSFDAVDRACLAGITSDKFTGHEVFYIVGPDLAYRHHPEDEERWAHYGLKGDKRTSRDLMEVNYPGTQVREGWWGPGQELRGFYDCSKAERLLDWTHGDLP